LVTPKVAPSDLIAAESQSHAEPVLDTSVAVALLCSTDLERSERFFGDLWLSLVVGRRTSTSSYFDLKSSLRA